MIRRPPFYRPRPHWLLGAVLVAGVAACDGGDIFAGSGKSVVLERPPAETSLSTRSDPLPFGQNLLLNPSFDSAVILGTLPVAPGNWRGDLAATVHAEVGIVPHRGLTMLKFLATGALPGSATLTSSLWQVVDLVTFSKAIAQGGVQASAGAWFNRIDAGELTDRRFDLRLLAFDGSPGDLLARYGSSTWLAEQTAALISAPNQWQRVGVSMLLPAQTSYVLVEIYASEDVFNDTEAPEFAGHYADDMSLVLRP